MRTGCGEFLVRPVDEGIGATGVRELDAFAQQLPRFLAAVAAAESSAKVHKCSCMLEPCRRRGEHFDSLSQQPLSGRAALYQAERAQRDPDRTGRAPPARELELRGCELAGFVLAVEPAQAERRL